MRRVRVGCSRRDLGLRAKGGNGWGKARKPVDIACRAMYLCTYVK